MQKFHLTAHITVSAYTDVEADTLKEAIALAEKRTGAMEGFGYAPDEFWIVEEIDGEAQNITAS